MTTLTGIVLTKNEENNIEKCLNSIKWCDEIIIVDDYSVDRTLEKIQISKSKFQIKSQIQIFKKKLNDDFAEQRNFGMEKASGEWVIFVDADEKVTRKLQNEISQVVLNRGRNDICSYYIKRRDYFWGRELKYGETKKLRDRGIVRLVKKNSGKWVGKVHEEFQANCKTGKLNGFLDHYPHQTIREFINEVNFYSSLRARELLDNGKKTNVFEIIFFPLCKFIYTYFIKFGFLDGPAGFTYAFFMSFHSFLVRTKLYQYTNYTRKSS